MSWVSCMVLRTGFILPFPAERAPGLASERRMPPPLATRTRPAPTVPGAANRPRPRGVLGPALLAAGLAGAAWAVGLHGTDTSAQAYRAGLAARHGLVLWDPGWYGGAYPLGYSVLAPLAMAVLGLGATGVLGAGAASWWFAVSTLIAAGVGQLPYLGGEAAELLALLLRCAAAGGGRRGRGGGGALMLA
ncbi:MAG: hypothetical protein ACYDEN_04215 [Acidimicrobiales bacterium]